MNCGIAFDFEFMRRKIKKYIASTQKQQQLTSFINEWGKDELRNIALHHNKCYKSYPELLLDVKDVLRECKIFKTYLIQLIESGQLDISYKENRKQFEKIYGFTIHYRNEIGRLLWKITYYPGKYVFSMFME